MARPFVEAGVCLHGLVGSDGIGLIHAYAVGVGSGRRAGVVLRNSR